MSTKNLLIENLKQSGVLKSHSIEEALYEVDRSDFVTQEFKTIPYQDRAFPIGYNQTISQPQTVVFMLELLNVKAGDTVLDIGSGSGWQAALISHITGPNGSVHTIEINSQLCEFAKQNVSKYPLLSENTHFYCQNAKDELQGKEQQTFDKIIAAAEVKEVPTYWYDKLKIDGTLVYPKDGGLYKEEKLGETEYRKQFFPGFLFVPFMD